MKKVINYSFRIILSILLLIPYFVEPFSVMAASNNSKATTIAGLRKELEALKKQKTDAEKNKKQTQSQINKNKQDVENLKKYLLEVKKLYIQTNKYEEMKYILDTFAFLHLGTSVM